MNTAKNRGPLTNIGPRISDHSRNFLQTLWPTANSGAQWVLASFPYLYERTLAELRGYFTKQELSVLVDATELVVFHPEIAGQTLLVCLLDAMALPTLKANYASVDFDRLADKVKSLHIYQRAVLELWVQGYENLPGSMSKGDYIAELLP